MNLVELKAVFLTAHKHERNIIYRNMLIILAIISIALFAAFHYNYLDTIFGFFNQSTDMSSSEVGNTYYKFMIPAVFIGMSLYPLYLIYKLQTRPSKINNAIAQLENGEKGIGMMQHTEYKTTIPILKIKLRLNPVEYMTFSIGSKSYVFPIIEDYVVGIKTALSGANTENASKVWDAIYDGVATETTESVQLKSLVEFQNFAKSNIYDSVEKMDAGRSKSMKLYVFYVVIIALMMGGYMYFNTFILPNFSTQFTENPMMMTYIMIGLVFGISFFGYLFSRFIFRNNTAQNTGDYTQFKATILNKIIHFINPNFEYLEYGHVDKHDINNSGLFLPSNYKIDGNDQILGVHNGVPFQTCDLTIHHQSRLSSENSGPDEVFKGQYFMAKFHKTIATPIVIYSNISFLKSLAENEMESHLDNFENEVVLEDPEFMKHFKICCADQVAARYALSTSMMERIKKLAMRNKGKLYIAIKDNQIVIANNNGIDKYEASLFTKMEKAWIDDIYQDLSEQLSIIDDLKLNMNIWKK